MADQWKNRIVGEGEEAPDQILAHPENWRVHPKVQQLALDDVLDRVGWVQRVIVNRTTGHLIDGHLRVGRALARGEALIPVTYVELTADEERIILATLDPLAALATTDREKLRELVDLVGSEANDVVRRLHAKTVEITNTQTPELRIAPEILERQDYLVIVFDNEIDWRAACDWLGVQSSQDADANVETQRGKAFGLGRVLTGKELLSKRNT